jgi:hypothetical protein
MQASEVLLTPALHSLDLAHLCAQYLQKQFQSELGRRSSESSESIGITMASLPTPPIMLPVSLTVELNCIAKTLADAFLNRGQ